MYTLKKSLGQHFLKDDHIIQKIVVALQRESFSQLLEVGPGGGALTRYLLHIPAVDFKAVEVDAEKVAYLEHTYPALKGKVLHQSFLDIEAPFTTSFAVIGNFPYNISSQILFKILEWKTQVPVIIGMFQKEVAQRIVAKEGSKIYGVLSVLIQAYYEGAYLFDVSRGCFTPPPKVESGVIRLRLREHPPAVKSDRQFFLLVKTAFNQRRKTLRNAVKSLFDAAVLQQALFDKRAEMLSVEDYIALTHLMR